MKKIILFFSVLLMSSAIALPNFALALQMPTDPNQLANDLGLSAKAYVVMDANTKQILVEKNADLAWTPASLTKLVTALVVLDAKPNLNKSVAISSYDQKLGACGSGGDCIKAKPGIKFTVDGLFHAALLPSANNAASALARSTGYSMKTFVAKMNAKAKALGATDSHFYEPTGMDAQNKITAADYAKITAAAFANPYLRKVAQQDTFYLRSTNSSRYNQMIRSTDKLLASNDIQMIGAKTGYLPESRYNFASELKYGNGPTMIVVVLGEQHMYMAFDDTEALASISETARDLAFAW